MIKGKKRAASSTRQKKGWGLFGDVIYFDHFGAHCQPIAVHGRGNTVEQTLTGEQCKVVVARGKKR